MMEECWFYFCFDDDMNLLMIVWVLLMKLLNCVFYSISVLGCLME